MKTKTTSSTFPLDDHCDCCKCEKKRQDKAMEELVRATEEWGGYEWHQNNKEEFCAIREYFKANPDKTSVMLYCGCRQCSPHC